MLIYAHMTDCSIILAVISSSQAAASPACFLPAPLFSSRQGARTVLRSCLRRPWRSLCLDGHVHNLVHNCHVSIWI